ncbi:hypothetical protein Cni_G06685 [Canna indica]|uniref:ABC transporter domain-containing protein n=1 Tax=Canna indica TaxID=4628 RepID=A0AAQ3JXI0_9LILI|nr:hypothetical protein Cni_G06685 [Canna indica]
MDIRDAYRSGSARLGSSSIWSLGQDAVFSRSSSRVEEDDEEALRWAALERLPTVARVRKGILNVPEGMGGEIDVHRLDFHQRKMLMGRLVRVVEEDNERFLLNLRDRIHRVGLAFPTIEVRYEHISIGAEAYVGKRGLPTFFSSTLNALESLANFLHLLPTKKKQLSILHDISGIIKPGRMTLLLGPPGSGKTTLLLALAGKLNSELKVEGRVTYNGHNMDEFVSQRTAAYIGQYDLHIAEMTVRETLEFSASCQGVGTRYDMLTELARREKAENIKPDPDLDVFMKATSVKGQESRVITDYILKILGLETCADTMVGDEVMRGISGGQKKRVTTGEMIVGPSRALFMDEISTGLDSSTTFQIVNCFRQMIHILSGTAVISLLQPAPETYQLFDDIILLSDGQIVYHGPREHVLEFFESMGFRCPERKGVADFLQEVTSRKDQQQYWIHNELPYRYVPAKEFADAFWSFHVGQELARELSMPFDKRNSHPAALTTSRYGVSKMDLLKVCMSREILLVKRNSFVYAFRAFQVSINHPNYNSIIFITITYSDLIFCLQLMILTTITMTLFLRTNMHHDSVNDGVVYMGALFFLTTVHMFNGFSELTLAIVKLPVFFKQRDYLFYPAWVYGLPTWILKIPITFVESGVSVFLSYYVIGFDPSAARLFKQYLLLLLVNQFASGLCRFMAVVGRNMVVASTISSFAVLVVVVLGGFVLSHDNIKKWWIWAYWISPLMYAQNSISTNEFLSKSWNHTAPGSTKTLGETILRSRGLFTEAKWYWIGVGVLAGYIVLVNILFTIALTYLKPFGKALSSLSEEALRDNHANRTGLPLEPSSKDLTTESKRNAAKDRNSSTDDETSKGMILPFTPLSITFDDIRYSVDMPQEMNAQGVTEDRLILLKGISGSFRPGVLTALMGVSGAGKTTLMDVLAGRKTGGCIEGGIFISGYPKKQETFARMSGYCEQNDIHSPHMTVYESLVFSAWLRLPAEITSATRKMFIEEVMELVELKPLREALVGLPGVTGLSTEQRKRLTIAVELVANPSIIFMDEPTSGLDARAAAIVMRTVRNTVNTGRTVVCTIHQPSIDIFEAFDELFLLKRGGEEIYVGPLGHNSCHLIEYFEGIEGVRKIKDGYNPATWMLEETSMAQEDILGVNFSEIYKNSELFLRNKALIKELSIPPPGSSDLHFPTQFSRSFLTQCMACLWKQRSSYWRNPSYTALRFFMTVIIGLLFGSIFWGIGSKRQTRADLFNSIGSVYSIVLFLGVSYAQTVQPVVSIERTVFYREKAAGMYSALPYALGQALIELPYIFVQSVVYGTIVYSMVGYEWTVTKFFWYLFFIFFTLLYFTYYGMMSVGLTPDYNVAAIVASAFYGIWNVFAGFVIPQPRIPVWWRWFYWICPVAWTVYGLVVSQFGDVEEKLDTGETVVELLKNFFGFRHDFLGVVAVVVAGFAVLFAFQFAVAIKFLNFQKR